MKKSFLFFAMLSAALICGEYAITRPISNALFLTQFSSKAYPWVWLATVPLNFFIIYLYNRFLPKIGPLRIFYILGLFIMAINAASAFFPKLIFFQYAWKDIYILLMLKQLWSMIHSTIDKDKAKFLYGSIYGVGTLGAIVGSFAPAFLAPVIGSEKILFATLPLYAILFLTYTLTVRRSGVPALSFAKEMNPRPAEAISLIRSTPILTAILLLVICMQTSVGLMEYKFNAHLELNILDKDLRSAYCGKLVGLTNICSLLFQFLGGFFLVNTLGLRRSHILIPVLLSLSAIACMIFPTFGVISFSYVLLKAVDFSLFNLLREMLYIPLPVDAKFRAKAIIDVFAYRSSKAFMSLGLLGLQALAGVYLLFLTNLFSITIFILWLAVAAFFFAKKRDVSQVMDL